MGQEKAGKILEKKGFSSVEEIDNIPTIDRLTNLFLYEYEKKSQSGDEEQILRCQRCGKEISRKVLEYSVENYDVPLCWGCQGKQRVKNGKYQRNGNEEKISLGEWEDEEMKSEKTP